MRRTRAAAAFVLAVVTIAAAAPGAAAATRIEYRYQQRSALASDFVCNADETSCVRTAITIADTTATRTEGDTTTSFTSAGVCLERTVYESDPDMGLIEASREYGCTTITPEQFRIDSRLTQASLTSVSIDLEDCPIGGIPDDCTYSRTVTLSATFVRVGDVQTDRQAFSFQDAGCVVVVRPFYQTATASATWLISGEEHTSTAGTVGVTDERTTYTCP